MKFRVRAQWHGRDGEQCGVAEDAIEAEDACEVAQLYSCPNPYTCGTFVRATITIEPENETPISTAVIDS